MNDVGFKKSDLSDYLCSRAQKLLRDRNTCISTAVTQPKFAIHVSTVSQRRAKHATVNGEPYQSPAALYDAILKPRLLRLGSKKTPNCQVSTVSGVHTLHVKVGFLFCPAANTGTPIL